MYINHNFSEKKEVLTFPRHFSVKIASEEPSASGGRRTRGEGGGEGTRQGRLKIKSTLVGNDSVSPRRHGALKYERYDEPRLSPSVSSLSLSLSIPGLLLTVISFPDGALALISAL